MAKSGNPVVKAFIAYRDVLVRTLVRLSVQPADVDDILQESLVRAMSANERCRLKFPKSYLFIVSRNIVFEQQERRSREVQWEIDEAILEAKTAPTDEEIHYRQMLIAFWDALASLPKAHQQAVLLRRIYGLSHKEIARKMGVSLSSVEKYFAQGIKRCQDIMSARGYKIDHREGTPTISDGGRGARCGAIDGKGPSHE